MKTLLTLVVLAVLASPAKSAPFYHTLGTEYLNTTNLTVSQDSVLNGSVRYVADTLSYGVFYASHSVSSFHRNFIVLTSTGGGNIHASATPTISTIGVQNGQLVTLIGGSTNTIFLQDNDTASGTLLELNNSTQAINTGHWIDLLYYDGSWRERADSPNANDQNLNTTDSVTFADVTTTDDATVGDDLTVTGDSFLGAALYKSTNTASSGAWVMPATLNVIGAVTLDSTLDVDGNVIQGAANYRSTFTAASGNLALTGTLAVAGGLTGNITAGAANYKSTFTHASGALALTGALSGESTLDIDGNVYQGAANYRSTFTAASGATAFSGAITSLAGFSGTTGTFSGDVKRGAANYISTFTASTGAEIMTGAFTSLASVTAPNIIATAIARIPSLTLAVIMAKTAVMGDIFICNNCSPVEVAISTAAGAPNTGGYANAVGLQLD